MWVQPQPARRLSLLKAHSKRTLDQDSADYEDAHMVLVRRKVVALHSSGCEARLTCAARGSMWLSVTYCAKLSV